jgi:hypothetical protein
MASRSAPTMARRTASRTVNGRRSTQPGASRVGRRPVRAVRAPGPIMPVRVSADFNGAFVKSPGQAERLTTDLLNANRPGKDRLVESGELLHFVSASGNMQQRRTLIAGFRKAHADLALVHHMATLPREQTAIFMKEYLDDGGSLDVVLQWLGIAGAVQRGTRGRASSPARVASRWAAPRKQAARRMATRGLFDWVGDVVDGVKKIGNAIGNAVDSVVDSIVKAGKSIAQAIGAAVNWTVAQVTDLVEALISAGKKVADILAAAATKGVEQLKKFVEAVLAAGRAIGEVLAWAVGQAVATVNAVVAKLLQLGRRVLDIMKAVFGLGRAALIATVKALLAAGKRLADLIVAMAAESILVVKAIVDALLAAGQALRAILVEAAKLAAAACRNIVSVLMELGKSLVDLLREAAAVVGDTLRLIVQALLGLGRTITQILVAAAGLAAATVKSIVQTLIALGKSVADIVVSVAGQALAVVKAAFAALVAAGRKVVEILVALAGRAVSALRTAMEALLAMGISLASLVKDIVTGVAEAFRRGFFEGLVALGKAPLQLLKAAAEAGVSVLLLAFAVVLEMCGGYRPLTAAEMAEARKVFGNAIDLNRVKLGFAKLPGDVLRYVNVELPRAFTTMYLLNFGPGAKVDMQTIIHELAHVWQGVQEGPLYMTRALEAQIEAGLDALFHKGKYDDSASYRVTEADLAANGGDLKKFNPEQQATILEFYWIRKFSDWTVTGGFPAAVNAGVVVPPVEALLPYAQKVNPALRATAKTAGKKKSTVVRPAFRKSMGGIPAYA